MPKEPKPNFASFTKAELVKTVKKLDARQTKLLNRIAELERNLSAADTVPQPPLKPRLVLEIERPAAASKLLRPVRVPPAFPWEKD